MEWEAKLDQYRPQMLSILRILVGLLFLQHGLQKAIGWPVAGPANLQIMSMVGAAMIIEIVGGVLFTVGLFTRAAAFIMSGEMAVAHLFYTNRLSKAVAPMANGGELEVFYCFVFLYFVFAGAGPWSLDAMMRKRT